jgi:predicted CXXCH cytochrome family protein
MGLVGAVVGAFFLLPGRASAQTEDISDDACLACHGQPDQRYELPSGETLYLTVDPETHQNSVHGQQGIGCVDCHSNITGYPHPPLEAQTLREVTISMYELCAQCHEDYFERTQDSVHQQALESGNTNAAVCTDCHGAHDVQIAGEPRSRIPQTCQRCHSQVFDLYQHSVHGEALLGEGNPDVPTCVDCHGVHNIQGPTANSDFRLHSPLICARCHADEELMAKYGINTDVFETYVADFHGTTVLLFDEKAEGQAPNEAVCTDCHGTHDIQEVTDENSTVIQENLLPTCQQCHPDASENFPAAWLGHYEPSPTHYPGVYFVETFYKFFIPGVLGVMAVFVVADASRRFFRKKENPHE